MFMPLLLGLAYLYASKGKYILSGCFGALATIKPQLAALPLALLLFWAISRKDRRRLVWSFAVAMAALFGISELLLPGWLPEWLSALRAYPTYNSPSLLEFTLGHRVATIASVILVAAFLILAFLVRKQALQSEAIGLALSSSIVLGVILPPNGAQSLYNHVLLVPAILTLWNFGAGHKGFTYRVTAIWAVMPWVFATIIACKALTQRAPAVPSFAPFNIEMFFPEMLLVLIVVRFVSLKPERTVCDYEKA
jgi:hypothetical protein